MARAEKAYRAAAATTHHLLLAASGGRHLTHIMVDGRFVKRSNS